MAIWYSLWSFGIFSQFWYVCTKKNMATPLTSNSNAYHHRKQQYCNFEIPNTFPTVTPWRKFEPTIFKD
jgi:hypothetical protein